MMRQFIEKRVERGWRHRDDATLTVFGATQVGHCSTSQFQYGFST